MNGVHPSLLNQRSFSGISIIIRAFNEGRFLRECLIGIQSQKIKFPIQLILVDSGSIDNTVSIARENNCEVINISRHDFSFGRALNLGITFAKHDLIGVISAHCIPVSDEWLADLVEPLISGRAEMSFGRHLAAFDCRSSESNYFSEKFPELDGYTTKPLLNNGNSAFLRQLWEVRCFNESLPAQEDMEFSLWHMSHQKARLYYSSNAQVIHYHNDRNKTLLNRLFRESCVEYYLGQRSLRHTLFFLIMIPYYIFRDIESARKKAVMYRALKGIFAYRAVQAYAYLSASFRYKKFSQGKDN